jgi:subtilisin family serine protease
MPEEIVINGKAIATDHEHQHADASSSNYIIIKTTGEPLNRSQKQDLKALGVQIQEFVGDEIQQLYLCSYEAVPLDTIRELGFIEYADVYAQDFCVPNEVETACADAERGIEVDILMHQDVEEINQELMSKIAEASDADQEAMHVDSSMVRVTVDAKALERLAAIDEVRVIHPVKKRTLFNNVARTLLDSDDEKFKSGTIYKGQGQTICVADTGFDNGKTTGVHDAFTGRVKQLYSWGRKAQNVADDPDGHGTHVCGSVLAQGRHNSEGPISGTAPAASLVVQSMFAGFDEDGETILGGYPGDLGHLFEQGYQAGARVHTNSWGTPLPRTNRQNPYDTGAASIDNYIWNHQDMTILFAAGNDGQDSNLDGKVNDRSLGAEAAAKNCITVGASENLRPTLKSGETDRPYTYGGFWPRSFPRNPLKDDHQADNPSGLAAFSSRGPSFENRLKPDVVAPGTAILSTKSSRMQDASTVSGVSSDSRYLYMSGTSMATPLVAGCCAAIRECLLKNGYEDETDGVTNPTASLIKALIINGAVTVAGQYMPVHISKEPNPHSGFGRVNLANSIEMIEPQNKTSGYGVGAIDEETEKPFELEIPIPSDGTTSTFKVTMAYADLPGAALCNDLNLVVVVGDNERHGNQGSREFGVGARQSFDRKNNVEQVVWHQATGDTVKVIIKHYRLVSPRVPFAYAWRFF